MRLQELRKEAGVTVKELSDYTGIAASTISSIENGVRGMTSLQVMSLSYFFSVSSDYLFGKSDEWISVYNKFDEIVYKVSGKEYSEFKEKGIIEVKVTGNFIFFKFGDYQFPTHIVTRTLDEKAGEILSRRLEADFDATISNLSPRKKQEVLEFLKDNT